MLMSILIFAINPNNQQTVCFWDEQQYVWIMYFVTDVIQIDPCIDDFFNQLLLPLPRLQQLQLVVKMEIQWFQ